MSDQINTGSTADSSAEKKIVCPITETTQGQHKNIPKAVFIDNIEGWVEKYTDEALFAQMNELYQKYKFMENQLMRAKESLRIKLPDIKKTLEMVVMLKAKSVQEEKAVDTNFLLTDNVWAKAKIPNKEGKVGLWLGANVMVEYSLDDALKLLHKNQKAAEDKI
jgi:prefoldin subunit 5